MFASTARTHVILLSRECLVLLKIVSLNIVLASLKANLHDSHVRSTKPSAHCLSSLVFELEAIRLPGGLYDEILLWVSEFSRYIFSEDLWLTHIFGRTLNELLKF